MSERDILKEDIYPNINRLDLLSPLYPKQHSTQKNGYITLNCPACGHHEAYIPNDGEVIICNRKNKCGINTHIWRYIEESRGLASREVFKVFAESANFPIPEPDSYDMKRIEAAQSKLNLIEDTVGFFEKSLWKPEGQETLKYLREIRKYSDEDIISIGFGHVPGNIDTCSFLNAKGYSTDKVNEVLAYLVHGDINKLAIPIRDFRGNLSCIIVRTTKKNCNEKKYLPLTTEASKSCPVNMYRARQCKEIIVVEGVLDPLIATARGMPNVIGIQGCRITKDQLEVIKNVKPERIILALDNEKKQDGTFGAGIEGAFGAIEMLSKTSIEVFVLTLPAVFKDPDELIIQEGIAQFKIIVDCAQSCGNWLGQMIPQKHDIKTEKGRRDAINEATMWFKTLNAIDRDALQNSISSPLNIPNDHWQEIIDEAKKQEAQAQYEKDMAEYTEKCIQLIRDGKFTEAKNLSIPIDPITNKGYGIEFLSDMEVNFLEDEAPELPCLINIREGQSTSAFIVRGIVGSVIALGGTGKTHYLTQAGFSVATGMDFLGKYPVQKAGRVIIVYGENSKDDIHRLLRKVAKGLYGFKGKIQESEKALLKQARQNIGIMSVHGIDASFIDKEGTPTEFYKKLFNNLQSIANQTEDGLALIIIDPASRFLGPEAETNNGMATKFIAQLEAMTQFNGNPTVLFAHHMNKTSLKEEKTDQGSARGSSALTDGPRLQINLELVKGKDKKFIKHLIKQKMTKSNHTKIIEEVILEKNQDGCLTINNTFKEILDAESSQNNSKQQCYNGATSANPAVKTGKRKDNSVPDDSNCEIDQLLEAL